MVLIGIIGKKGHGKDTIGDYIVNKYKFKKIAFADSLKKICGELFGFTDEQLYGNLKEEIDSYWNVSPRTIFQFIGTDLIRNQINQVIPNIGKDFWVKNTLKKIKSDETNNYIICDVRFENEADKITENGGILIKVIRSDDESDESNDLHISENSINEIKNVKYIIENNSDLEELYKKVDKICSSLNFVY
ncbi:MAG: hypothetical protein CMF62_02815 [Magnetococcales bacterium]|nr:hypothetical protein [Magnetococcales bacterium]|tara:strand:+ start:21316 stop:21885 length:570 start_codon:yes stop_codon:yes gene_type:complete